MTTVTEIDAQPELIARRAVALPLWRAQLECQVQETKEIGVLTEFVLKAIDAELQTSAEIATFLDLPVAAVVETMAALVNGSHIALSRRDRSSESFVMTPSGRALLRDAVEIRPARETVTFFQDPLTGELSEPASDQILGWRQVEAMRLWVIPAVPSEPPVFSAEDNLRLAASYARSHTRGDRSFLEVVDPAAVTEKRFVLGEIRVERSEVGIDYEVWVDGRPNRDMTIAFLEKDLPATLRIPNVLAEDQSTLDRWAREIGMAPVNDPRLRLIAERAVRIDLGGSRRRATSVDTQPEGLNPGSDDSLARLAERIEETLRRIEVRFTSAAEHGFLLQKAFRETKDSLTLVCPDVDPVYWGSEVAPLITSVAAAGVSVSLFFSDQSSTDASVDSLRKSTRVSIGRVARGFPSAIVVDQTWAALSTATWGARVGDNAGRLVLSRGVLARREAAVRVAALVNDNTSTD